MDTRKPNPRLATRRPATAARSAAPQPLTPAAQSAAPKLPPALEMEVMKALWRIEAGTVGQVREQMRAPKPLAYTTVMTMLDRLARKGVVTRVKQGRGYRYAPVMRKDDALQLALDRIVCDFFGGAGERLIEHLVNARRENRPAAPAERAMDSALL